MGGGQSTETTSYGRSEKKIVYGIKLKKKE